MKKKVLIVIANYYKKISESLLLNAVSEIKNFAYIKIIEVPGVFEIPVTISKNILKYDGFVALGCVIKGKTPHFNFISKSTINALMSLSITHKKPIGNGIITCLNKHQALIRSDSSKKNKGGEAARAMISILKN